MHPDTNLLLKALANQHRRQILGWLRDPQKHFQIKNTHSCWVSVPVK